VRIQKSSDKEDFGRKGPFEADAMIMISTSMFEVKFISVRIGLKKERDYATEQTRLAC
jgi:hypothetical protein